ncbi:hypothetical protein P4G85_10350 [Bacillus cereus]|uniref:YVTN beta-propeller repeat-containing protein n=1 Tax=Bacillus thuringiensis Sbt003 TaxID=1235825 RepID=A0A9X0F9H3_BACTU|nr:MULTISPECIES: hypothetical protein [Bacillus cereus group]KIU74517.1 YVTN beta-propeller repeat-containing protein [Bacillus thuringiensis Sbt003]MEB8748726.1 hypothetical protein [Bacillus cereus]MEB8763126.1 hypothetical protein [Bacillus cereus]MEB8893198.1 hypothetical protein [Bacillus cereus]
MYRALNDILSLIFTYIMNQKDNNVEIIEVASGEVVSIILFGTFPHGIAITPNDQYAYIADFESNTLSIIRT